MLGVRRWSPRSRTGLTSVRRLAALPCSHVRRRIGLRVGVLVFWLARHPARCPRSGWSPGGQVRRWQWPFFPLRGYPRLLRGIHRGPLALWLGGRCGRRGCVFCHLRRRSACAIWHGCLPGLASHVACQCPPAAISLRHGGPGCRCPALRMRDPRRELAAWRVRPRGASRDGGMRRVRVRDRAGGRVTARWCFRGPYCRSGWWVPRCWGDGSACAGAGGWYPGADLLGVSEAWGLGLPLGMSRWGRMVPRSRSGRALVASVGVAVHICSGGRSDGAFVGPSVGRTGWLWCGWGSRLACVGAASWWPRVDASGGVWGCGPGSPAGPGPGPVCGRTVPKGCSGRALAVAVFVWLGMVPLAAGDACCSRIAVAAWCCGWCHYTARLDALSCRVLSGVPAPDGAGTPAVRVESVVCGRCGEWTVAWGLELDGLEDVEVVGLCGVPALDYARARTLVAPVAAVARDRGWVVMVAVLRGEVEELWF